MLPKGKLEPMHFDGTFFFFYSVIMDVNLFLLSCRVNTNVCVALLEKDGLMDGGLTTSPASNVVEKECIDDVCRMLCAKKVGSSCDSLVGSYNYDDS